MSEITPKTIERWRTRMHATEKFYGIQEEAGEADALCDLAASALRQGEPVAWISKATLDWITVGPGTSGAVYGSPTNDHNIPLMAGQRVRSSDVYCSAPTAATAAPPPIDSLQSGTPSVPAARAPREQGEPVAKINEMLQIEWLQEIPLHTGMPLYSAPQPSARAVHEHDCPTAWAFWEKYALGPKSAPSCLVCGQSMQGKRSAITHAELPGIVICEECVAKVRSQPSTFEQCAQAYERCADMMETWAFPTGPGRDSDKRAAAIRALANSSGPDPMRRDNADAENSALLRGQESAGTGHVRVKTVVLRRRPMELPGLEEESAGTTSEGWLEPTPDMRRAAAIAAAEAGTTSELLTAITTPGVPKWYIREEPTKQSDSWSVITDNILQECAELRAKLSAAEQERTDALESVRRVMQQQVDERELQIADLLACLQGIADGSTPDPKHTAQAMIDLVKP